MHKVRLQSLDNPEQPAYFSKNVMISTSKTEHQILPLNELMLHLSRYRELKQLPLNFVSEFNEQLWRDSPCTVRCPNRNVSIDKIQRFALGSIYYRDNINEQKKIFTQTQKPELMLKNFRRQIQEASHSKHKYSRKFSQVSADKVKANSKLGLTMPMSNNKFYEVPKKLELKYDRNGTRSTFAGDYDVKQIIDKFKSTKSNFTSSRRMDLGLPLNFHPGPGNYFTNLDDSSLNKTHRQRKGSCKVVSNKISQRQQRKNEKNRKKQPMPQQILK